MAEVLNVTISDNVLILRETRDAYEARGSVHSSACMQAFGHDRWCELSESDPSKYIDPLKYDQFTTAFHLD